MTRVSRWPPPWCTPPPLGMWLLWGVCMEAGVTWRRGTSNILLTNSADYFCQARVQSLNPSPTKSLKEEKKKGFWLTLKSSELQKYDRAPFHPCDFHLSVIFSFSTFSLEHSFMVKSCGWSGVGWSGVGWVPCDFSIMISALSPNPFFFSFFRDFICFPLGLWTRAWQ